MYLTYFCNSILLCRICTMSYVSLIYSIISHVYFHSTYELETGVWWPSHEYCVMSMTSLTQVGDSARTQNISEWLRHPNSTSRLQVQGSYSCGSCLNESAKISTHSFLVGLPICQLPPYQTSLRIILLQTSATNQTNSTIFLTHINMRCQNLLHLSCLIAGASAFAPFTPSNGRTTTSSTSLDATIAVIGASGLTASECVYQALKEGDTVIGLTR